MDNKTITKAIYPDFSKDAHERTIEVLLKDKLTGQVIGRKQITKGQLAKAMQPFGRTCHEAINGKFVLEV
jgi:hypothetical protein